MASSSSRIPRAETSAAVEVHPAAREIEDATLVLRARDGDRWAQGLLFERHAPAVASLAGHLLGSREDAADIVQDTFVAVLSDLAALRDPASFRGWVLRVAVRQAHRRFRRRRILRALGLAQPADPLSFDSLAVEGSSPEELAELARIDAALRELPLRARSAWLLHRVEGATLAETAHALECSLATAKRDIVAADSRIDRLIHGGA
jgi:RNA polymerase sigma-70 factor (ECF subfamily)